MRAIDLTGRQFGKLTVIAEAERAACGKRQWSCRCTCGNIVTVIGGNLTKGSSTSCGCSKMADIEGKLFGNLTAIQPTASRDNNGNIVWECRCKCGETAFVGVSDLTCGKVRSCGCLLRSELKGKRFGRLTVLAFSHVTSGRSYWSCRCDCGTTCTVCGHDLSSGDTRSCGCLRDEMASARMTTHGMSNTRIYKIWKQMLQRCENPNDSSYPEYGALGIRVCEEWHQFLSFAYWSYSVGYSDCLSIDRINPFLGYEPNNCRWATDSQQGNNKRRSYLSLVRRYYEQQLYRCVSVENIQYIEEFWTLICTEDYWSDIFRQVNYTMQDETSSKILHEFVHQYVRSYLTFLDWAFSRFAGGNSEQPELQSSVSSGNTQFTFSYNKFLSDLNLCLQMIRSG